MKKMDGWYDKFLETLNVRFPKKSQLVEKLMELLNIERGAAYRRLSKKIPFTFFEIVRIAFEWNISLDHVFDIQSEKIPFLMIPVDFIDPPEDLTRVYQVINLLKEVTDIEAMEVNNVLSRKLYAGFPHLLQFFLFKCKYEYGMDKKACSFSEVIFSERSRSLISEYYQAVKNTYKTYFILDRCLFDYLISDIRYFHSIQMVTDEEKELIKQDLYQLLDYLWDVANNGCYPETGNQVNLYISHLHVNTNYSYAFTEQVKACFVHVFEKFEIYTYNPKMVLLFKEWMQLKKRTSYQISEVDEKCRIAYFSRQRQLLDAL